MTTKNIKFRNPATWLTAICCLVFLLIPAGCTLQSFSELEKKALENGTISVGAVRVMNYDNNKLELSRGRLIEDLNKMRLELANDANILVPQFYGADIKSQMLIVSLGLYLDKFKGDFNKPGTSSLLDPCGLSEIFHSIMKNGPRPGQIEMVGLRMAALKFIESEIEDLNLTEVYPVPSDRNRVVINLDLTAWVTGKAKAALVYVDVYPCQADSWCHEAADILRVLSEKAKNEKKEIKGTEYDEPNKTNWYKTLGMLQGGFVEGCFKSVDPPTIHAEGLYDCVAACHNWLENNNFRPRIIQVERMSPAEYSMLAQDYYSGSDLQAGGAISPELAGSVRFIGSAKTEKMAAKVRPLNLAFVAGSRRAGWLFMPAESENGRMPPTERKLRMVVDVPKSARKLGIHVHKVFLNSGFHIIPGSNFASQMNNLDETRAKLIESESFYEQYNKTEPRHYRLIKTRIRNLLHQGWSEEIVADIPPVR